MVMNYESYSHVSGVDSIFLSCHKILFQNIWQSMELKSPKMSWF